MAKKVKCQRLNNGEIQEFYDVDAAHREEFDALAEAVGFAGIKTDNSYNFANKATARIAGWYAGNVAYVAQTNKPLNCVEFTFDLSAIRGGVPSGLSNYLNIFLFGLETTAQNYSCKVHVEHDGSSVKVPNSNTPSDNGTTNHFRGTILLPDYADADTVRVYVFRPDIATPSDADIVSMGNALIAKACDMIYDAGVSCNVWITPAYGQQTIAATFREWQDGVDNVTLTQLAFPEWDGSTIPGNNAMGVLGADFTVVATKKVEYKSAYGNQYIREDSPRGKDLSPFDPREMIYTIPSANNVAYWFVKTAYLDDQTIIRYNHSEDGFELPKEDEEMLKRLFPQLGDYKGLFSRTLNSGGQYTTSVRSGAGSLAGEYSDILTNGKDGDWYIYRYYNGLNIKNTHASFGDIVYRLDANNYVAIENPLKWGNWQTVAESSYDIVIVGAGAGGVGAAYSLLNSGLKVLLVDKMNGIGGTHTKAGLHQMIGSPVGDWFKPLCRDAWNNHALIFNGNGAVFGSTTTFDDYWDVSLAVKPSDQSTRHLLFAPDWLEKRYFDDITAGSIDVRCNRKFLRHTAINHKVSTTESRDKITSLVFLNEVTGAEEKVYAKYVIDCTGDVYVGRYNHTLGTDYFLGSDPGSKYNESAAAGITEGNIYDINTCEIMYRDRTFAANITNDHEVFTNEDELADKDKDFPTLPGVDSGAMGTYSPPFFLEITDPARRSAFSGQYFIVSAPDYHCGLTTQMLVDNGADALHEIADDYARAHYKLYRKNSSRCYLGSYPLLAIREGYRMHCEYMVTQADIEDTITSANYEEKQIVALSSWFADIHQKTQNVPVNTSVVQNTYKNGVPYLALVPKSYTNLLIACRGYGASHIGLSGIRLIKCMMGLGRAAGFAAKQCVEDGIRDVRDVDVAQVQSDCGVGDLLAYLETNVYPSFA